MLVLYMKNWNGLLKKIGELLPDRVAFLFNGWSCGQTHYLGIFGTTLLDARDLFQGAIAKYTILHDRINQNATIVKITSLRVL